MQLPPGYWERPVVVDAFSCEGGMSAGFVRAGFRVIGIEKDEDERGRSLGHIKRYPFEVVQGDVLEILPEVIAEYGAVAAGGSPPCQADSDAQVIQKRNHPQLIAPFRELVVASGLPYWIENVGGAVKKGKLRPDVMLCGLMFDPPLKTDRHRWFETNFLVLQPEHPDHAGMPKTKMGRTFADGALRQYVGNFKDPAAAREDLGVPWMSRRGIAECIPPVYGEHVGTWLQAHLASQQAA